MGLTAIAYEHAELIEAGYDEERVYDLDADETYACPFEGHFESHPNGLVEGIYRVTGGKIRESRPYTGYGRLRDLVSRQVTGMPAEEVWQQDDWDALPLGWWINFSDNEGILGPQTCRILADQADEIGELEFASRYDTESWEAWRRMFRLAADTGMICYA